MVTIKNGALILIITLERNKEKLKVLLLCALAITLLLALPRLAIILFIKFSAAGRSYALNTTAIDFILRSFYIFVIAVIFLWINTRRGKIIIAAASIDLGRFYQRFIINIILYLVFRFVSLQFNLHVPGVAVSGKFYDFLFNITLILEIVLCILAAEIYMLMVNNQQIRLRNEALQKVNAETTFEVLKNQVNPHFLFNSLNTIHAMIGVNNDAAKEFVNNMSQVYRHVLNSANKPVVTLAEEIEFAMAYINMLQERHAGNLAVETDIAHEHLTDFLPPMSLQILLENAVKHNVVSAKQPLTILVQAKDNRVTVCNSIRKKKIKPPSTGTGLYNLNRRYLYLCKSEIEITRTENSFNVSLPLLKASDAALETT